MSRVGTLLHQAVEELDQNDLLRECSLDLQQYAALEAKIPAVEPFTLKGDFRKQAGDLFRSLHLQDHWQDKIAAALQEAYERGFEDAGLAIAERGV
jgi:hypothetical protein